MRSACLLGLVLLAASCMTATPRTKPSGDNGTGSLSDGSGSGNGDGAGAGDGVVPSTESDFGQLPPLTGELPTIVALDWSKFPQDPGPDYAVQGRTWIVKTTGTAGAAGTEASPMRWMFEAAKRAQAGDMIRVYGGTYNEPEPVEILHNDIVLTAAAGEKVVLAVPNKGTGVSVRADSGVVVNGINMSGVTLGVEVGRALSNTTMRNIVISNLTIDAGTGEFSDGIRGGAGYGGPEGTMTIEGLLIKNVTINNTNLAVSCSSKPCGSWRLENVKIKGRGMDAGESWGGDGIGIENGDNMLFYNVEVSDVNSDGIDTKASRIVVWGCNVHHVGNNGVKLWQSGDIVNTVIHDLSDEPSIVAEAVPGVKGQRLRILHTTIANQNAAENYGVVLGYDHVPDMANMKVEIIDSIYYKSWGAIFVASTAQLTIQNSLFFGSTNGEILRREDIDGSAVRDVAGLAKYGSGNLAVDPKLDGRYHLQQGSPAANAGMTIEGYYPTTDATGQPRVKGSLPDIGAFEDF